MRKRIISRRRVILRTPTIPAALPAPIIMNHEKICRLCAGSSRHNGKPCPICEARGHVQVVGDASLICAYCSGSAKVGDDPCEVCGGMGLLDENRRPLTIIRRNGERMVAISIPFTKQQPPDVEPPPLPPPAHSQLIAPSRIDELRSCAPANLDFKKLIRLCEEINISAEQRCWYAVAALTRAILDHVPPALGQQKFEHVVANYAGTKSFKDAIRHLDEASRKIADAHLHERMRPSEVLPTLQQVNCGQQLDALLGEIVRITPRTSKAGNP